MKVFTFPHDQELAKIKAAERLNAVLSTLFTDNHHVLLLLAGGSALDLVPHIDISLCTPLLTIGPLDERFSTNPEENNWMQIMATDFYKNAVKKGCAWIDTRIKRDETPEQLAQRLHTVLYKWMENNPEGTIVATMGIGTDGHTAGIMPFPEDPHTFQQLFNSEKLAVSYDASGKNPHTLRITTTQTFLEQINVAVVYAVGQEKKEILHIIRTEEGTIPEIPGRVLQEMAGEVYLFTDQEE